ncbi:MAG: hypothetical protein JWO38_3822 [Gemmataceae bacterium]|nr:hypothetical protein [Gemmataceae bacterium]
MPRAIAVPVRRVIVRRWQRGQTAAEIAAALQLVPRSVRHLLRHAAADPDLAPAYARCGRHRPAAEQAVYEHALDVRRQHPTWGAGLIRVFLRDRFAAPRVPSERTLQRWFHAAGLGPAPAGRQPHAQRTWADRPHEVWQIDAVEELTLKGGQRASWLRITDEFTGAILDTKVFPIGCWAYVGGPAVQAELRKALGKWGRPQRVRVDNGTPWGATGGLPTALALWLCGLGVAVVCNHPRRPRENAIVERTQGVSQQWAEPQTCASPRALQRRLDHLDRVQREQYPSIGGRSRCDAYPGLTHSGRPYGRAWERRHRSLPQALAAVAEYAARRRVDQSGRVWLYDVGYAVGKAHVGEDIYATLDAETEDWVFQDADGRELRRQPARTLTAENICRLQVGRTAGH